MSLKRALVLIVLVLVIIFLVFQLTGCRDERALFASEITLERTEVAQGEDITVSVRITNTGESDGDQTVRLDFGENRNVDSFRATLSPGERVDEELNYTIPTDYPYGDVDVTVRTEDDSDTATITIVGEPDPAFLEVEILEVGGEPPAGEVTVSGSIALEHNFRDSKVTEGISTVDITEEYYEEAKIEDIPNQYIVKYADGALKQVKEQYDVVDTLESFNYALVEVPEVAALSVDENVISFEQNQTGHLDDYVIPNVSRFSDQWDKFAMRLPQAWRSTTGDIDAEVIRPAPDRVRVAILDTGIHATHRELGDFVQVDEGWDVAEQNASTHDYHGHGTHVAGIVAANNHHEITGTMWEAELIPIKLFPDEFTQVDSFRIGKGMAYAAGYEVDGQRIDAVDIMNMSVSGGDSSYMQEIAATIYNDTDTIMVTSAGNNGADGLTHPGTYDEVISVGSVRNRGSSSVPTRASYSSIGPELDITAPGSGILSLRHTDNDLRSMSGTSMASPNLVGVIGLMLANGIDPADVEDILYRTAIDLGEPGWNEEYGHGMVNAYWAVNAVSEINISIGNYETTGDITDDSYTISNIPEGEYQLTAWIDVRNNGIIENGDYVAQKDITLTEDKTIDLTLEEFYQREGGENK